jgi:hypothetical protein
MGAVVRKGSTASWVGDHTQTTLWQIDKNLKSETGDGTQKPVECMRRPIENCDYSQGQIERIGRGHVVAAC